MDCIISLTTWRERIFKEEFLKVLFSLLNQKTKFKYKVVLVLSSDEFPQKENEFTESLKLFKNEELFEILWTKENTKAYKKYFPTKRKYKDIPIITVDDDEIAKENFVETIMQMHVKDKTRIIYGYSGMEYQTKCPWHFKKGTIGYVRYAFALFPPNSLYDLDEKFGMKYFKLMDDEFMSFLAILNGTHYFDIDANQIMHCQFAMQDSAMWTTCRSNFYPENITRMWTAAVKENPELNNIYAKNKNILN